MNEGRETIEEYEAVERFRDMLDEVYGPVNVCGYEYEAGRLLQSVDPIAFREGMLSYFDGEGWDIV